MEFKPTQSGYRNSTIDFSSTIFLFLSKLFIKKNLMVESSFQLLECCFFSRNTSRDLWLVCWPGKLRTTCLTIGSINVLDDEKIGSEMKNESQFSLFARQRDSLSQGKVCVQERRYCQTLLPIFLLSQIESCFLLLFCKLGLIPAVPSRISGR